MTPQQIEQMRINSCRKCLTMYGEYAAGAMDASEWQRKRDIEKACEWLKSYRQETPDGFGYIAGIVNDKTIEDFRKAMEKEP